MYRLRLMLRILSLDSRGRTQSLSPRHWIFLLKGSHLLFIKYAPVWRLITEIIVIIIIFFNFYFA